MLCMKFSSSVKTIWSKYLSPLFQDQYVGNKAKGRISKRVFQENKAR